MHYPNKEELMTIKKQLLQLFKDTFNIEPDKFFISHGRMEIIGNHTDHNHGKCMSARCDKAIYALVQKSNDNIVEFYSKGHNHIKVHLDDLDYKENEKGTSAALVRGVLKYLSDKNFKLKAFKAVSLSTIPSGSGLSSSAAFETIIGNIINHYANEEKIDKVTIAKAGQFAENIYFGKSCGLLDQISVVYPAVKFIDFKNIESPVVETISFPFDLKIALVNTKGSHAGLDGEYSSIPEGMKNAANKLGVNYLRETDKNTLNENKNRLNDREYALSSHFFEENERVDMVYESIKNKDIETFKTNINASCDSSTNKLQNTMLREYEDSPLQAIEYARSIDNKITTKLNGGGFKGTVINFINSEDYDVVLNKLKSRFGDQVIEVSIDNDGKDYYSLDEFDW